MLGMLGGLLGGLLGLLAGCWSLLTPSVLLTLLVVSIPVLLQTRAL